VESIWAASPGGGPGDNPLIAINQFVMLRSRKITMMHNHYELTAALDSICQMQPHLVYLRRKEPNSTNDRLSASGFLSEIDRVQLDMREHLIAPATTLKTG